MPTEGTKVDLGRAGKFLSAGVIAYAAVTGICVLWSVTSNPRTDDAEIFANYIGIAPVVSGPILRRDLVDNEFLKQGEPLFEIDQRPYEYALAGAKSDLKALQGQIDDES